MECAASLNKNNAHIGMISKLKSSNLLSSQGSPWLKSIAEHLPQSDTIGPNITCRGEPQVIYAFWSTPTKEQHIQYETQSSDLLPHAHTLHKSSQSLNGEMCPQNSKNFIEFSKIFGNEDRACLIDPIPNLPEICQKIS